MGITSPQKIHIIGGPGSGKTTLARQLAASLAIPACELDVVGYENGAGADRPLEVRLAEISELAARPAWVSEGIFLGWTAALFEAAHRIIWLDLPWPTARWRIFTRHLLADLRGNNKHTGWRKLFLFMRWCGTYYDPAAPVYPVVPGSDVHENRATTAAYLAKFAQKVVHCQTPSDVTRIKMRLCQPNR